jgi:hypothetical protein
MRGRRAHWRDAGTGERDGAGGCVCVGGGGAGGSWMGGRRGGGVGGAVGAAADAGHPAVASRA